MWSVEKMSCFSFSAVDVVFFFLEMGRRAGESSEDSSGLLEVAPGIEQLPGSGWRQLQQARTATELVSRPAVGQGAGEEHRINMALVALETS